MANDVQPNDLNTLLADSYTDPSAAIPQPTLLGNLAFQMPTPTYNQPAVYAAPTSSNNVGTVTADAASATSDTGTLGLLSNIGKRIADIGVNYLDQVVSAQTKTSAQTGSNHQAPGANVPAAQSVPLSTILIGSAVIGAIIWASKG